MTNGGNGWTAYEKMVLAKIEQIEKDIILLDEKVTLLRIDVAQLKIKAGIWGAVAGLVPALVTAFVAFSGSV